MTWLPRREHVGSVSKGFSTEFKISVVKRLEGGEEVARRYGLNSNLLFTWRRREQAAAGASDVGEPVNHRAGEGRDGCHAAAPAATPGSAGRMEIVLGSGERIIGGADVDAMALVRIIKALTRR